MTRKADFFEIKDEPTVHKLLELVCRNHIPVTIWFKRNTLRFEAKMRLLLPGSKTLGFQLPAHVTDQMFNDTLSEQGSKDLMASFQLDKVNFFFKSNAVLKDERDFLKIEMPELIYKLQRRSDMRVPLSRAIAPKLSFLDPTKIHDPTKPVVDSDILAFRILDISVGGLGFAAKVEDKAKFVLGAQLLDMRFKFREELIQCLGIVRHVATIVSDQGKLILKVGVQFNGLQARSGQLIFGFVIEEGRKLFQLLQEAGGGGSQ